MSKIETVNGLDVRPGMRVMFTGKAGGAVIARVTGSAREERGGRIVNVVAIERVDNGKRGSVVLTDDETFRVSSVT